VASGFTGGGGEGGGGGGGGTGAGGGGYLGEGVGGERPWWRDWGVVNYFVQATGATIDPWDNLKAVLRILESAACGTEGVTRAWRAGGAAKQSVKALARARFYLAAEQHYPHGHHSGEARRYFALFPEQRELAAGLDSGAISCAAALLQAAPDQPGVRRHAARAAARAAAAATTTPGQVPGQPPTVPTLPPGQREPSWVTLARILAEQWRIYQEQQRAQALERAQRRAMRMGLSDTVGDILGGLAQGVPQILPAILQARAADQVQRQQLRLARMNFTGLGLPGALGGAVGATGAALAGLLGEEPGTLESGGMFENLGLEGDVERTVTLWKRTGGGFRPVPNFYGVNPATGRMNAWVNAGRPLLWSRDLAVCRNVDRIARRALRSRGGRGRTRSTFRRRARR
jgi:hypothetical protein